MHAADDMIGRVGTRQLETALGVLTIKLFV